MVATELEKGSKGALKEMVTVIQTFSKFEPFGIRLADGKRRKFDSLVFANINEMAKYATLSEAEDHPSDGKFEVIVFPHMPKWRTLLTALKATTQGLGDQPSVSSYEFTTLKPLPYQMDGEVKSVEANVKVTVECAPPCLGYPRLGPLVGAGRGDEVVDPASQFVRCRDLQQTLPFSHLDSQRQEGPYLVFRYSMRITTGGPDGQWQLLFGRAQEDVPGPGGQWGIGPVTWFRRSPQ